jgi:hypothetical protein
MRRNYGKRTRREPEQRQRRRMGRVTLVLVLVVVLVGLSGAVFLATWDFHVPRTPVQKVVPDARFPQ